MNARLDRSVDTDPLSRMRTLFSRHAPRGRPEPGVLERRYLEQVEMFHLAQVICYIYFPNIQQALDEARRDVMKEAFENTPRTTFFAAPRFRPIYVHTARWTDFQITPEVTIDMSLEGATVSRETGNRLVSLHRQQVKAVTNLISAK